MFEGHSFDAQCMGSIIGMMAADEKNDWSPFPCYVRRLVSPSGRLHNEDGLSNGSDFSTFGKDETAKLPENTGSTGTHTHTHGWHQDGERHCFTSKFQVAGTIWTSKAQRRTAWRVLNELKGPGGEVEISACRREAEDGRHGGFLYKLKHSQHDDDAIEIERCNLERHPRPTGWENEISNTLIVCTTNS